MFVVLKCEICSLKSTFDCFHEYSRLMWVFLCITLWTSCISREIIIETLNFPKSKMRDTTGDQLSIIWFVLLFAKCSSVMFDIIGNKKTHINREYSWKQSKVDFSEHISHFNTTNILYFVIIYKQFQNNVGQCLHSFQFLSLLG
jgi:hypothetical protein